jgi:hypothetical protein
MRPRFAALVLGSLATGRRYGQALAVSAQCPGGKATAKAEALKARFSGEQAQVFTAEANRVVADWKAALGCVEADPETGRMIASCRKIKKVTCSQAWLEIGPEGSAMPGLVEFKAE